MLDVARRNLEGLQSSSSWTANPSRFPRTVDRVICQMGLQFSMIRLVVLQSSIASSCQPGGRPLS
jgi:hypothetical protein